MRYLFYLFEFKFIQIKKNQAIKGNSGINH